MWWWFWDLKCNLKIPVFSTRLPHYTPCTTLTSIHFLSLCSSSYAGSTSWLYLRPPVQRRATQTPLQVRPCLSMVFTWRERDCNWLIWTVFVQIQHAHIHRFINCMEAAADIHLYCYVLVTYLCLCTSDCTVLKHISPDCHSTRHSHQSDKQDYGWHCGSVPPDTK